MWTENKPLKFINDYLSLLNESLEEECKGKGLSYIQKSWIGFCLMGILLTNTICWAKFERMSFMSYTQQALSWMFRRSKLPWDRLLQASVLMILRRFGIAGGYLVIDDKDIHRSKNARKLYRLHKMKDKKTAGYVLGQNIVFLYLPCRLFVWSSSIRTRCSRPMEWYASDHKNEEKPKSSSSF